MEDEPRYNLRLYGNSVHIEEASKKREKRYGTSLVFKSPFPFFEGTIHRRFGLGLAFNAEPDLKKKSGEVNVFQHFYSLNSFLEFNYVALFRFSVFAGPGVMLSLTKYNVLDTKDSHSEYLGIAIAGFAIDYSIVSDWEFSWRIEAQHRPSDEKWDWRQGLGLVYNF